MPPITFVLESFAGALPLRFGMTPEDVIARTGPPDSKDTHFLGGASWAWFRPDLDLNVGFDKASGLAAHFAFGRGSSVEFRGLDVFGDPAAWQSIVRMSADSHEWVGFVILCDLGLQLSGFHDNDPDQLAISMFPRGAKDHHRHKFKPFSLPAAGE